MCVYIHIDIERNDRGNDETFEDFSMGIKQKIEGNIKKLQSNCNFKNDLLNLLYTEYQDSFYAALIGNKEFFWSASNCCIKIYGVDQE